MPADDALERLVPILVPYDQLGGDAFVLPLAEQVMQELSNDELLMLVADWIQGRAWMDCSAAIPERYWDEYDDA